MGSGFIHAQAATRRRAGFFQLGALLGKPDFGEAQEDDAEDRAGVFLGLEAGVGAGLVGGVPKALFKCSVVGVFFGWGNPNHSARFRVSPSR